MERKNYLLIIILIIALALLAFAVRSVYVLLYNPDNYDYVMSLKYCPYKYPNSKWVCRDTGVFFYVDNRQSCFIKTKDSEEMDLKLVFRTEIKRSDYENVVIGCVKSYNGIAMFKELFLGRAVFYEGKCEIHFIGEDDKEHVFGNHTGEVVLVFVMEQENDSELN